MPLDPLGQIDLAVIGASIAIFLVTFVLLRRIFLVPVISVMEERARKIAAAHAGQAAAEQLAAAKQAEADGLLAGARAEAARIADQAQHAVEERRRLATAKASTEAEGILARGRQEIVALRAAENERLRTELEASVGGTLAHMVGAVDAAAVRLLVRRALASTTAG